MAPSNDVADVPTEVDSLPQLQSRNAEGHKGNYGQALLIGGSLGMSGAIALAGMAALRSGAGLVRLAVPNVCLDTVAAFEPSYMTLGLPVDSQGRIAAAARTEIEAQLAAASVLACGPGLGRSKELNELVVWLYSEVPSAMVLDADALNTLAEHKKILERPGGPRVLTPHPGEFARLTGEKYSPDPEHRKQACFKLARRTGATIVLKGHESCISDGRRLAINKTGNPGMATGGAGDVLTGVITALLCQGLDLFEAAQLGVHVHGLAGDLAAKALGQVSLMASDLVRNLPAAYNLLPMK